MLYYSKYCWPEYYGVDVLMEPKTTVLDNGRCRKVYVTRVTILLLQKFDGHWKILRSGGGQWLMPEGRWKNYEETETRIWRDGG
ncbi:Nn.00g017750.m01.CDS01 [Neocucurbitaria sp. VM-36]